MLLTLLPTLLPNSKAKAALLKQRAKNSMFDDDDDEWGDTDALISKVQTRKESGAGALAIQQVIQSTSAAHTSSTLLIRLCQGSIQALGRL